MSTRTILAVVRLRRRVIGRAAYEAFTAPFSSATTQPTAIPTKASVHTWHKPHHFTGTVSFLGSDLYEPDRNEQVTSPWRGVWQAHLDSKDAIPFTLGACHEVHITAATLPDCTMLVFNGVRSGTTTPITSSSGDISSGSHGI